MRVEKKTKLLPIKLKTNYTTVNGPLAKKVEVFWQHSALPLLVVFEHTMNFIKSYCVYSEYIGNREP